MKTCPYFKRENGCISCVHPNPIVGNCPQDQCEQEDNYVQPEPKIQPKQSALARQMQQEQDDDWYVYGDGFSDNYCDEV